MRVLYANSAPYIGVELNVVVLWKHLGGNCVYERFRALELPGRHSTHKVETKVEPICNRL